MNSIYPIIGTKWICNQNGGMKIEIISRMNDLNYHEDFHFVLLLSDLSLFYMITHEN